MQSGRSTALSTLHTSPPLVLTSPLYRGGNCGRERLGVSPQAPSMASWRALLPPSCWIAAVYKKKKKGYIQGPLKMSPTANIVSDVNRSSPRSTLNNYMRHVSSPTDIREGTVCKKMTTLWISRNE